jgi:hypothetical protein
MNTAASADGPKVRGNGVLTLGILGALIAATGVPTPDTLEQLVSWGVPEMAARAGMYVAPVVVIVAAMLIGRALGAGRSPGVRWTLYAVLGAVAGFFLSMCLEVFAGLPPMIERATGPLGEAGLAEIVLWALAGFGVFMGLMLSGISIFGRPGLSALQVEEVDEECLDVRRAERAAFGWSAFGMITLGVACAALAVARQAGDDGRFAPVVIALVAGAASALANYVLWRSFDELQRRHVINGYATSAIVVTLGAFVWAALEPLQAVPRLDATSAFLALVLIQTVATMYVTAAATGAKSMLGAPA